MSTKPFSVWYSCLQEGDPVDDWRGRAPVTVDPTKDASWCASQAADHYFGHHDGWEASWPRIVRLYAAEDAAEPFAEYEVSMEAVPQFWATTYTPKPKG